MTTKTKIPALVVRDLESGAEVHRVEVPNPTERKVEKVLIGMLHRVDLERFYVDDAEFLGLF
jgi:hypothetical protein